MQVINTNPTSPHKNLFDFTESSPPIRFDSDFDGGNLSKVTRQSSNYYLLWIAADCEGMDVQGYSRSWFYFSAQGFKDVKVVFVIHRVQVLWSLVRIILFS